MNHLDQKTYQQRTRLAWNAGKLNVSLHNQSPCKSYFLGMTLPCDHVTNN